MARPLRREDGEEEDVDDADEEDDEGDATALVTAMVVRLFPEDEDAAEPEASRLWGIARERCIALKRLN